jgi:hypothetical protein
MAIVSFEAAGAEERYRLDVNFVAPNLFDVFDVRVLAGRGFVAADAHPTSPAVIVDQTFADRLERGGSFPPASPRRRASDRRHPAYIAPSHQAGHIR